MKIETNPYSDIKTDNRNRVFNLIREAGSVSRPNVSRQLGISIPTAIQHINELEEMGCIRADGSLGNTGGRRAKSYSVNAEYRYAMGVYILAEKLIITAADFCGNQLQTETVKIMFTMDNAYYMELSDLLEERIDRWKIDRKKILGVGIALPALVTEDRQRVYYGKVLNFTGISVQELGRYIQYPCRLYNEADAAGYAEIAQCKDTKNAFYISLGEHVGGAVLIDGNIYNTKSGKVGHLTMVPGGKKCYCGRKGCFETVCNASILREACGGEVSDFFKKLESGDSGCVHTWKKYVQYLAEAIVNVRMLFDNRIIVGGGVAQYMPSHFDELLSLATELDTFDNPADYLRFSQVQNGAAALGSALPFIHELWQNL